jgi:MFS family permease
VILGVESASSSPWRNRDFQRVWAGGLVNDIGDWLLMIALPVYVFTETASGLTTALLFLVELAPAALLGRVAGAWVDRWDLRRTLVATNLLQSIALLPLLAVTPHRVWPAFVVAASESVLARFNNPAKAALLPRLVARDRLGVANAAIALSDSLSRLVGAPLGGVLVDVTGLTGVVVVDGLTFLFVAIATATVRADTAPLDTRHVSATADGTGAAGLGSFVVRRTRPLPTLVGAMAASQFAQGLFLVLILAFVVDKLGGDGTEVGLLRGMQSIGGVLGSVVVGRVAQRARPGAVMGWGFIGMGVISAAAWNTPTLTTALGVYVVFFVVAGPAAVGCSVGTISATQVFTPPQYLGRVIGTLDAAGAIGAAAGTLTAGVLVDHVDVTLILDGQAAVYVLCGLAGLLFVAPLGRGVSEPSGDRCA